MLNESTNATQDQTLYQKGNINTVEIWYKIMLIALILFSVPLNSYVFIRIVFFKTRGKRKRPRDFIIASMASSDIFQAVLGYGLQYVAIAAVATSIPYCNVAIFLVTFLALASMNHIVALAIDGYLHICQPWFAAKSASGNRKVQVIFLGSAWLYAAAWTIPILFWRDFLDAKPHRCMMQWRTAVPSRMIYLCGLFIFCLIIPVVTTIGCLVLRQRALNSMRNFAIDRFGSRSHIVSQNVAAERRHLKISLCIFLSFITVWTPYATIALLEMFKYKQISGNTIKLKQLSGLFAKSAVILNPVIYKFMGKKNRQNSSHRLLSAIYLKDWPVVLQQFRPKKDHLSAIEEEKGRSKEESTV